MLTFIENNTLPLRHWLTQHESLLLGGALGFFHSGPIGLVIGSWLGNYIGEKIQSTTQQVQRATQAVQPIVAPISFVNNKLQNLWQLTRSGYQASKDWFTNQGQPNAPQLQVTQKAVAVIGQTKRIKDIQKRDKGQPKKITQDTQKTDKADKGQPKLLKEIQQDSHRTNIGQPTLASDSQSQTAASGPSLLQTAGDMLDMMNGYADDSVFEQYGDSWLTRDISELPTLVLNQFRGFTQRFWSQPSAQSAAPAIPEVETGSRATLH